MHRHELELAHEERGQSRQAPADLGGIVEVSALSQQRVPAPDRRRLHACRHRRVGVPHDAVHGLAFQVTAVGSGPLDRRQVREGVRLLDEFLELRDEHDGLPRVYAAYQQWRTARTDNGCATPGQPVCPVVSWPRPRSHTSSQDSP